MSVKFIGIPKEPVETLGLGVFDGLHLGHQVLASQCQALLTLFPHPSVVLGKNADLQLLSTPREIRYFYPHLIQLRFTREISRLTPVQFLDLVLSVLKPKRLVVGYDYRFGLDRSGDFLVLSSWARMHDIEVVEVPAFSFGGRIVKSSDIRACLISGDFATAVSLMGHPYVMMGRVVHGDNRGAALGFPTANLALSRYKLIPASGVYGARVIVSKIPYPAIVYIGTKPTFSSGRIVGTEVHIPGFSGSLYGQTVTVLLTHRIRGDMRFESADALVHQIQLDLTAI